VEASDTFACFGASASVFVMGDGPVGDAPDAVASARRTLLSWHARFTRFDPGSELSRLNADRRRTVPVSPLMATFAAAVVQAADASGGLVDATLLRQVEAAGYRGDLRTSVPLAEALALAPPRRPAAARPRAPWRSLVVDTHGHTVSRPPGLGLDSGGLAKGLFADVLAATLAPYASLAVECAGDLRVGGAGALARPVRVECPFDGRVLHTFRLADAGVATSGIGKRSWIDDRGRPAHHLLDPATGRPAYTGVVQATAIAPTAIEAEMRAKAAVLSGPDGAGGWLPHGGVVVLDDGTPRVLEPVSAPSKPALGFLQAA
jgi:thiamine biosynthesis lipoprotein